MTTSITASLPALPSVFTVQPEARKRMRDFFSSHIRNPNTRRAYLEAVRQFSAFCAELGIEDLALIEPIHVAAFVEAQLKLHSKPTVKQRLAALRMLFDWMVVGQVLPVNPAHAVRGPKHTQRRGKTPVLQAEEARTLIDAIDTRTSTCKGVGDGCASTRKAARNTRCRPTTILTATLRSTSPRPESRAIARGRCSGRRGVVQGHSLKPPCFSPMCGA
jgi:integrase